MKRLLIVLGCFALLMPATARADDPRESCSAIACVTADTDIAVTCGDNGRGGGACAGTASFSASTSSALPAGGIVYEWEVYCETGCLAAPGASDSCTHVGLSSEGDPGCSASGSGPVTFMVPTPSSGCVEAGVLTFVDVRHALDPTLRVTDFAEQVVTVCA